MCPFDCIVGCADIWLNIIPECVRVFPEEISVCIGGLGKVDGPP